MPITPTEHYNSPSKSTPNSSICIHDLQMQLEDAEACSPLKLELPLRRKDDGSLPGVALTYIRSCMKNALSQIWSLDMIENQRECHQRDNSPASELIELNECESLTSPHLNVAEDENYPTDSLYSKQGMQATNFEN